MSEHLRETMAAEIPVSAAGSDPVPPPAQDAVPEGSYAELVALVRRGNLLVLTGAGMSTSSGIPDYRGPEGHRRVQPMSIQDFRSTPEHRRRYWARGYLGWPIFRQAQPNDGHRALAAIQAQGLVSAIITQNVDELHQRAGSTDVVDLHGSLARVVCLHCGERYDRQVVQDFLALANPGFGAAALEIRPDGDVELDPSAEAAFRVMQCLVCGSDLLKPDVVFFGESVPRETVTRCFGLVEQCDGVLVLGSSLAVMSGLRFVRRAAQLGLPVAVVNRGWTRADSEVTLRLDTLLVPLLTRLASEVAP